MMRPMISFIFILAGTAFGADAAHACAEAQQPTAAPAAFRVHALDLDLDLDYEQQRIAGVAAITLENWTAESASVVPLLVGRLMTIESVRDEEGLPLAFEQAVTVFSDWTLRQVTAARVRLPAPVAAGGETRITVRYAGHLVGATETGMRYVRERLDPEFTVVRDETFAFPVIAEPSLASLRGVPRQNFAFTARVTVPDTLTVATGGLVVERTVADGRATYSLRSGAAVPFLNLPVAPYVVVERRGVRAYLLPADSARGEDLLALTDRALAWFGAHYGQLTSAPRFAIMEIPDGYGSQADLAAGIMIEASALARVENRVELYHEISHLWNAPDAEAPSSRWNEGLATYLQHRVAADLDGADLGSAAAATARNVCRRTQNPQAAVRTTPLSAYGTAAMTGWSYTVGALLFHVLEGVMGRDAFDAAYRDLFQATTSSSVSLADLERAFVRADARTARVFENWVNTPQWHEVLCSGSDFPAVVAHYRGGEQR